MPKGSNLARVPGIEQEPNIARETAKPKHGNGYGFRGDEQARAAVVRGVAQAAVRARVGATHVTRGGSTACAAWASGWAVVPASARETKGVVMQAGDRFDDQQVEHEVGRREEDEQAHDDEVRPGMEPTVCVFAVW